MIFHSVFTGNPGTGKTTVARKLGKIYRSLGLLSKGEVIAVDRTRLVGQYLGQTEDNMKVVLEEAKGNVLFIDEAYDLSTGSDDRKDFGYRVLESLLTVLTQPNPDMLIIFAGYEKEMNAMLNSNPGLQGRFPYHYRFDDYSADQLMEIALKLFERDEYILTDEAAAEMQDDITQVLNQKLPNFGNARWVEQFVNNGIIPAMADRIYASGSNDLQHIEAADVSKAFEKFKPAPIDLKSTRHRVKGFRA
jgi:SpoVK/Ycf46/Vps4 family AAA+-type ATPase